MTSQRFIVGDNASERLMLSDLSCCLSCFFVQCSLEPRMDPTSQIFVSSWNLWKGCFWETYIVVRGISSWWRTGAVAVEKTHKGLRRI